MLPLPGPDAKVDFRLHVARRLAVRPRYLHAKYFYDEAGSALFEEITRQPEYYPTRTEASILRRYAPEIGELMGGEVHLVELGSGSSAKTRILLESLLEIQKRLRYLPIDISPTILHETAVELDRRYPALDVTPIASQYETGLSRASLLVAEDEKPGRMLVLFLGSSIGNMEPHEAESFLARIRKSLGPEDAFLVGFDLVKDRSVLHAAYNDAAEITARFNRNMLVRINRELGGDFEPHRFSHLAFFHEEHSRIEMHLVSKNRQEVFLRDLGTRFEFEPGETIHTESSYKYTRARIEAHARSAGLQLKRFFTDEREWFALALLAPASAGS